MQSYGQREYHKENIHMENNQKKISEKIEDLCEEIPTSEHQKDDQPSATPQKYYLQSTCHRGN